jgi:hypothetical protein
VYTPDCSTFAFCTYVCSTDELAGCVYICYSVSVSVYLSGALLDLFMHAHLFQLIPILTDSPEEKSVLEQMRNAHKYRTKALQLYSSVGLILTEGQKRALEKSFVHACRELFARFLAYDVLQANFSERFIDPFRDITIQLDQQGNFSATYRGEQVIDLNSWPSALKHLDQLFQASDEDVSLSDDHGSDDDSDSDDNDSDDDDSGDDDSGDDDSGDDDNSGDDDGGDDDDGGGDDGGDDDDGGGDDDLDLLRD